MEELLITVLILAAIAWLVRRLTAPPSDYTDDKGRLRCGRCKKIVYDSDEGAQSAAENALRRGVYLRAYYENKCSKWHLTSQRPR